MQQDIDIVFLVNYVSKIVSDRFNSELKIPGQRAHEAEYEAWINIHQMVQEKLKYFDKEWKRLYGNKEGQDNDEN